MDRDRSCEHRPGLGPLAMGLWTLAMGLCVAATAWGEYASGSGGRSFAFDAVLGLVSCGLVPLIFRWPVPTAIGAAVLAALTPLGTPMSTLGTLYVARRRPLVVACGVAVVGIAAHLARGLWSPTEGLSFSWWMVLVVVGHAALVGVGALAQTRSALIASLEERARRAEAEQGRKVAEARAAERTRLAREMHDVLAHRLSLLSTYAGALEYRPDAPPEKLSQAAGVVRSGVHQALDELRDVISILREEPTGDHPNGRDVGDGVERPVPALADLPRLVEECRAAGTPVGLHDGLLSGDAPPGTSGRTAYRVLQEALTNARKHAPGQQVNVALDGTPGGRLEIEVSNPLNGHHGPVPLVPGSGTGLVGLTERVRLAGGQLNHQAVSGEFRLHAWLPWPA